MLSLALMVLVLQYFQNEPRREPADPFQRRGGEMIPELNVFWVMQFLNHPQWRVFADEQPAPHSTVQ